MAQAVLQSPSEREKVGVGGLDQSISPTLFVSGILFNAKGFTTRYGRAERIGGKTTLAKYDSSIIAIHFLPNGAGAFVYSSEPELTFISAQDLTNNNFGPAI